MHSEDCFSTQLASQLIFEALPGVRTKHFLAACANVGSTSISEKLWFIEKFIGINKFLHTPHMSLLDSKHQVEIAHICTCYRYNCLQFLLISEQSIFEILNFTVCWCSPIKMCSCNKILLNGQFFEKEKNVIFRLIECNSLLHSLSGLALL